MPQYTSNQEGSEAADWGYTTGAAEVAALRRSHEVSRGSKTRETIGRDTPILEGVYEGTYGGEAITVAYEKDPVFIDNAVDAILVDAKRPDGTIDRGKALRLVFEYVKQNMQYNSDAVEDIFSRSGGKNGAKISLGVYAEAGVGVCRHQALYAGAIIEKLISDGVLRGKVSVDRNQVKGAGSDQYDGHAWTRYTTTKGEVIILDVAQGRHDYLDTLAAEHREDPKAAWDYERPEDKQKAIGHQVDVAERARKAIASPYDPSTYMENGLIVGLPWKK